MCVAPRIAASRGRKIPFDDDGAPAACALRSSIFRFSPGAEARALDLGGDVNRVLAGEVSSRFAPATPVDVMSTG